MVVLSQLLCAPHQLSHHRPAAAFSYRTRWRLPGYTGARNVGVWPQRSAGMRSRSRSLCRAQAVLTSGRTHEWLVLTVTWRICPESTRTLCLAALSPETGAILQVIAVALVAVAMGVGEGGERYTQSRTFVSPDWNESSPDYSRPSLTNKVSDSGNIYDYI